MPRALSTFEEVIESQMAGGCSVLLILFYDDGMGVDDLEPSSSPYVLLSLFQWEKIILCYDDVGADINNPGISMTTHVCHREDNILFRCRS